MARSDSGLDRSVADSLADQVRDSLAPFESDLGPVLTGDKPTQQWVEGQRLLDHSDSTVSTVIDRVADHRQTPTRAVAAALVWKTYSYQMAMRVVLPWMRHGILLDTSLAHMAWDAASPIVPHVAFTRLRTFGHTGAETLAGLDQAMACLFDNHFEPLVERIRLEVALGPNTFLGLAVAGTLGAVANNASGELAAQHATVDQVVHCLPDRTRKFVEVAELQPPGMDWRPYPLRRTCCLAYKVGSAKYCGTCNLLSDDERTTQLMASGYAWRTQPRQGISQ